MLWPAAIVVVMLAIWGAETLTATKEAPPQAIQVASQVQVKWLIRYCNAVQVYLETHGGSGQISNSQLGIAGSPLVNAQYAQFTFKNFASGPPNNLLQCWVSPASPSMEIGEVADEAEGSELVGTATSATTWTGVLTGAQQPLVQQLPVTDIKTVVVLTGY